MYTCCTYLNTTDEQVHMYVREKHACSMYIKDFKNQNGLYKNMFDKHLTGSVG